MGLHRDNFAIYGVSIAGFGPARSIVHLPVDDGLTVIVGQNGSGKTSILRGVESALSGVDTSEDGFADVHIWLEVDQYPESEFAHELAVVGLRQSTERLQAELINRREDYAEPELSDLGAGVFSVRQALEEYIKMFLQFYPDLSESAKRSIAEAVEYGAFTLRSIGSIENPAWDVYLSVGKGWETGLESILMLESEQWVAVMHSAMSDDSGKNLAIAKRLISSEISKAVGIPGSGGSLLDYLIPMTSPRETFFGSPDAQWPDGVQFPFHKIATVTKSPGTILGGVEFGEVRSADEKTRAKIQLLATDDGYDAGRNVSAAPLASLKDAPRVPEEVGRVSARASYLLSQLIPNAPTLRFDLKSPDDWFLSRLPEWQYRETEAGRFFPLRSLSYAQMRWVIVSIELALSEVRGNPTVLIVDEPERGLHPLAVHKIVEGLSSIANDLGGMVLVASHSPYLVSPQRVDLYRSMRHPGSATSLMRERLDLAQDLTLEATLLALGMSKSDSVHMFDKLVIVEGLHDKIALSNLLRGSLTGGRVVLPMHGAKHASSLVGLNFLTEVLDVPMLVVLDNVQHEIADEILVNVRAEYGAGNFEAAEKAAESLRYAVSKGDEGLFLSSLMRAAIQTGQLERIELYGLQQPDIICYLPTEAILLRENQSWDSLISSWKAEAEKSGKSPSNIKGWLRGKGLLTTSEPALCEQIHKASSEVAMSPALLPKDLQKLAAKLERRSM